MQRMGVTKSFLPAYLKKFEEEVDVQECTVKELVEINLDLEDP